MVVAAKDLAVQCQELVVDGDGRLVLDHHLQLQDGDAPRNIQRDGLAVGGLHEYSELFVMNRNKAWARHLVDVQGSSSLAMFKARPLWLAIKPNSFCKNDLTMKFLKELDVLLLDVVKLHELVLELKRDEHLVRCFDEQEHLAGVVDPELLAIELTDEFPQCGLLTLMRLLVVGREVQGEGVHCELLQHFVVGFQRLNPIMPAIGHDQAQAHDIVVKMAKLPPGDHDLLIVRVALAADVELLGYL